jgi:hypothetical protein
VEYDNSPWNLFYDQQFDVLDPRRVDAMVDKEHFVGTRETEEQYRFFNAVLVLRRVPGSMAVAIDVEKEGLVVRCTFYLNLW